MYLQGLFCIRPSLKSNFSSTFYTSVYFIYLSVKMPTDIKSFLINVSWKFLSNRGYLSTANSPRDLMCCLQVLWNSCVRVRYVMIPRQPLFFQRWGCRWPLGGLVLRTLAMLVRVSPHKQLCVPRCVSQQSSKTSNWRTHMRIVCPTEERWLGR